MRAAIAPLAAWLALAGMPVAAESAPAAKAEIHDMYMDGDFPRALQALQQWLDDQPSLAHEDSVFAYKHLGVMHVASPEARDKGRQFLRQLLFAEPHADLLDMFASETITTEFRKVQSEHAGITAGLAAVACLPIRAQAEAPAPPRAPLPPQPRRAASGGKRPAVDTGKPAGSGVYWVAGGAGLVAAAGGLGLFLYLNQDQQKIRNITIEN